MTKARAAWMFATLVATSLATVVWACGSSNGTTSAPDAGVDGAPRDGGAEGAPAAGDDGGDDAANVDSGCHNSAQCGGATCVALTLPKLCGFDCDPITGGAIPCTDDSECADGGPSYICDAFICNCPHGGPPPPKHCRLGCSTAAECGTGLTCNAQHRCEAAPCNGPVSCGSKNFVCVAQTCTPATCTKDSQCAGFCVNGACSATAGYCLVGGP
jgi:hypothetical protein